MDNFDNKINNNLEDKAWASMKVLLDKEMPEMVVPVVLEIDTKEKKKRRFLFIFLFVLGLIGTGLGYLFYVQKSASETDVASIEKAKENNSFEDNNWVKKKEKLSIINAKNEEHKDLSNTSNTEELASENKLIEPTKSLSKTYENRSTKPENSTYLSKNKFSQNIDNQLVTKEIITNLNAHINFQNKINFEVKKLFNEVKKSDSTISATGVTKAHLTQNSNANFKENNTEKTVEKTTEPMAENELKKEVKEEPYFTKIKPVSSTDLLEILYPKPIYFDIKNISKSDFAFQKSMQKTGAKKWSYGLISGINTEGSANTLGGFGGIFFQRILRAKWSLNTGLNYRVLEIDAPKVEYLQVSLDAASNVLTTTSGGLQKVNLAYLQNLNYLEIPIQINYLFTKKLSFFGGAKVSYMVSQSISSTDNSSLIYVVKSQNYGSSLERIIADKNYTSDDLGLNKWDAGLLGGVNYHFSKRFSTQLRYDLGLTDIYQGANETVYNRFIGLNVAYRF
jgi:Outer membrane protein beta-barrel domain